MNKVSIFVCLYLSLSVLLGLYTSRFIKSSKDFCLAGRNLSLVLCSSTMFSTWFGAETIIGASSEFLQHGFLGVIEDPFGTSLCFILIGLFIARSIYKLNIITIVDLFKIKYGVVVEKISAIFMILSYIGWIAAQLLAMAIIMQIVFNFTMIQGIIISSTIVCFYTISGGMWSISINDFIQTIVIIIGLLVIAFYFYNNNAYNNIINTVPDNFFNIIPDYSNNFKIESWLQYIVAWMTIGLGSIPQQDVFQRVMSAKSEKTAVLSSYIASIMYIIIGFLPLFIALSFIYADNNLKNLSYDQVLLTAILQNSNDLIKTLFFGALLSAIMSSASGAILAPATILGENIIKPFIDYHTKYNLTDKNILFIMRLCVLLSVVISATYAIYSPNVYLLVAESSVISLISLFMPFIAALYLPKTTTTGALLSMILGPSVWLLGKYFGFDESVSILSGFMISVLSIFVKNLKITN